MAWDDDATVEGASISGSEWNDMVTEIKSRSKVYTGSGIPSSNAEKTGDLFVDTDTNNPYVAANNTGTWIGVVTTTTPQTLVNKTITSASNTLGAVNMSLGSDAEGDIYYRNSSGYLTRLAIGSPGQILSVNGTGTAPEWTNNSGGSGGASFVYKEKINGEIYTGNIGYFVVPDELNGKSIKEVRASLLGLPSGQPVKVDVRKNGTATTNSVFTGDVPVEISSSASATNGVYQSGCDTAGSTVGTAGTTLDAAQTSISSDDVLYVYVTQVGSTITGTDLVVEVVMS